MSESGGCEAAMGKEARNVVLYPRGGLGNQLFQYGATLQLSIDLGCRITVDDSLLNPKVNMNVGVASRHLELDEFENQISTSTRSRGLSSRFRSKAMTIQRLVGDKVPRLLLKVGVFANERTDQIELFRTIRKPVVINSYCSSPAYFSDCQDELANQIGPVKDKVEVLLENANKLIENLNATLDASTQQKLKASIASLELTMSEFSKISKNANEILSENK